MFNWNEFVQSSTRIFTVSRKPGNNEYKVMAQVTGLGIIVIGIIGFFVKIVLVGGFKL
ncbi:MAG: protein translocase SEC61 complex subunit gamma [Candidatus Diapherotrites archaeon]|uniref:Protein translocase SEC61 complex subunit gamma n=1 Tax=Candidatus Iainarchaeum sp. TaxID=3101447 RepID=A0A8T3YQA8_9ARCH|nr:protein translocase SEC61 complex subunit gamma [Candidatus Diapherotrites archaeon]